MWSTNAQFQNYNISNPVPDESKETTPGNVEPSASGILPDGVYESAPTDFLSRAGVAFQHRDFRWFQAARLLIMLGTEMLSVAVGWQVYELTNRPLDLGY